MSINKAQAKALADGFLDNIGSGKDGLVPRETLSEIFLIAGEFIEEAQDNLNRTNSNASGNLSRSLAIVNPTAKGLDIEMDFYGQFVNKGVKGTKSGSGLYAFKGDIPGSKMIKSIEQWIKRGKRSSRNVNKKKTTSANEKKNKSISEIDNAFAVARSVMQKGIKATGFIDKAAATTAKKMSDRIGEAFSIDVKNSLPPTI